MKDTDDIEEYILAHIDAESDYLQRLYRDTNVNLLRPRMASGHLQGRMLKMFVEMIQPLNILEIGTYTGYSALCMAEGLSDEGHLYTFEINDEQEDFTRPWIDGSPLASKIDFIIGDAMQLVPTMNITFDMAFIDGDKRCYSDYYDMVMRHVRKGGYILADNTLWDGHVLTTPDPNDKQTQGIMQFNDKIAADSRIEKVILPLRDGLTIIRKLE
jgi:caffeoyl-CoA O-methyltransferase